MFQPVFRAIRNFFTEKETTHCQFESILFALRFAFATKNEDGEETHFIRRPAESDTKVELLCRHCFWIEVCIDFDNSIQVSMSTLQLDVCIDFCNKFDDSIVLNVN